MCNRDLKKENYQPEGEKQEELVGAGFLGQSMGHVSE